MYRTPKSGHEAPRIGTESPTPALFGGEKIKRKCDEPSVLQYENGTQLSLRRKNPSNELPSGNFGYIRPVLGDNTSANLPTSVVKVIKPKLGPNVPFNIDSFRNNVQREATNFAKAHQSNFAPVFVAKKTDTADETLKAYHAMPNFGTTELLDCLNATYDPFVIKIYIVRAAEELARVHDLNIAHCDVKPHNFMVTDDGLVKLIDFGLSTNLSDENQQWLWGGDPDYAAPEQYSKLQGSGTAVDVFSFGVLIAYAFRVLDQTALLGMKLYEERDYLNRHFKINYALSDESNKVIMALIKRCLNINPARRPTMTDVVVELEQCLLEVDNAYLFAVNISELYPENPQYLRQKRSHIDRLLDQESDITNQMLIRDMIFTLTHNQPNFLTQTQDEASAQAYESWLDQILNDVADLDEKTRLRDNFKQLSKLYPMLPRMNAATVDALLSSFRLGYTLGAELLVESITIAHELNINSEPLNALFVDTFKYSSIALQKLLLGIIFMLHRNVYCFNHAKMLADELHNNLGADLAEWFAVFRDGMLTDKGLKLLEGDISTAHEVIAKVGINTCVGVGILPLTIAMKKSDGNLIRDIILAGGLPRQLYLAREQYQPPTSVSDYCIHLVVILDMCKALDNFSFIWLLKIDQNNCAQSLYELLKSLGFNQLNRLIISRLMGVTSTDDANQILQKISGIAEVILTKTNANIDPATAICAIIDICAHSKLSSQTTLALLSVAIRDIPSCTVTHLATIMSFFISDDEKKVQAGLEQYIAKQRSAKSGASSGHSSRMFSERTSLNINVPPQSAADAASSPPEERVFTP